MKKFALVVALLVGCGGSMSNMNRKYANVRIKNQYESSVKISTKCEYEDLITGEEVHQSWRGTGVAITDRAVLTASHVLDCNLDIPIYLRNKKRTVTVTRRDGTEHEAYVNFTGEFRDVDIGMITVPSKKGFFKHKANMSMRMPLIGEWVCVASANPSKHGTRTCGQVQHWNTHIGWGGAGSFTYNAKTMPGTSGSGIFDEQGDLVGIHVGAEPYRTHGPQLELFGKGYHLRWVKKAIEDAI